MGTPDTYHHPCPLTPVVDRDIDSTRRTVRNDGIPLLDLWGNRCHSSGDPPLAISSRSMALAASCDRRE